MIASRQVGLDFGFVGVAMGVEWGYGKGYPSYLSGHCLL
jgi:hypothetical protein